MTDQHDSLDSITRAQLTRGDVLIEAEAVVGSSFPRLLVRAVVDAPPHKVWPLIDRCGAYDRTIVGVKRSMELSRQGNIVRVRATVGLPFPFRDLTSITEGEHIVMPDERYVRRWHLVEGDYRTNSGSWTLTPFAGDPNRTLIRYELHAEPNIAIPARIQQAAQRTIIPRVIERLRKLVR